MIIFQKKLFFLITFLLTSNFLFADPCSLPENTISLDNGDVWYNVNTDIAGFQFEVDGTTVSGASGGDAASAGFTVSAGGSTVLGFSFTGATISAGCGTLTSLSLNGEPYGLSGIVFSDTSGNGFDVSYNQPPDCDSGIFDCLGVCDGSATVDCNGVCDGSSTLDECGVCNGDGISDQECDCDGNVLDECGVCGGSGLDEDEDGICDDVDGCVGNVYDECGVCNGDGIADGTCDCDGNVLDECGVCNGNNINKDCNGVCFGNANVDECNDCTGGNTGLVPNYSKDCNGICFGTAIIDECDICSGGDTGLIPNINQDCNNVCYGDAIIDDCGICSEGNTGNEFNANLDDCDICFGYNENLDCNGICFGDGIDSDNDGICDDEDDCDGVYDECGICNGDGTWCLEGSISFGSLTQTHLDILYNSPLDIGGYQFSISGLNILSAYGGITQELGFNISNNHDTVIAFSPTGNFIPSGNGILITLVIEYLSTESCFFDVTISDNDGDEINFNLGPCIENIPCDDIDVDTICDDIDPCVGEYDDCGICEGSGLDEDEDGICDDVDDCVGDYDECGVCNGEGISDQECDCDGNVLDECGVCGGDGISDQECDCDGNVLDECGACGGSGLDEDEDGICDDVDDCVGEYDECGVCNGDSSSCMNNFNSNIPSDFYLSFSYPNPFNPETTFDYGVPKYEKIEIKIFNSNGKIVETPVNYHHSPGNYTFKWNAKNYSSGVYYFQLISNNIIITRKATLLK